MQNKQKIYLCADNVNGITEITRNEIPECELPYILENGAFTEECNSIRHDVEKEFQFYGLVDTAEYLHLDTEFGIH